MARSHLTLAALATSAVPDLDIAGTRSYSYDLHGDFESALLTSRDGTELIIRVPASQDAETEQSADLIALQALTAGVRARLPFDVPDYVGQTPIGGTRAVLYTFLPGSKVALENVQPGDGLAASIGRAVAAVHSLPTSFATGAGLPALSASDCLAATKTLIASANGTGLVPAALAKRWKEAVDDDDLWRFQPTVINGALTIDSFIVREESVVGVIGWSALRVGDPARDLHWVLGMNADAAESAIEAYSVARGAASDPNLLFRATLYAELELARWLMHGRQLHDQVIVDDAVSMLDSLVERVHEDDVDPLAPHTGPIMAVDDVEALLDATPVSRDPDDASRGLPPVAEERPPSNDEFDDRDD
ncbi:phosphotransferase [Planctomonas sp. JC2975]|uniref:phosphotransferase n=1 Tax=Planctomonas sp. JC2975 TaxID=2729626 RepID=UPI0014748A9C|nr:phosphotransferase [Planctomonas sp. JC2975]NNC11180.1 phosphotransferase [Planctomonas sp. JC2975]